jgi:hypothetical protein
MDTLSQTITGSPKNAHLFLYRTIQDTISFQEILMDDNLNIPSFVVPYHKNIEMNIVNRSVLLFQELTNDSTQITESLKKKLFKGFIEKENEVYVIMDCSNYIAILDEKYKFFIIDEIYSNSSENKIHKLLNDYSFLVDNNVDKPIILYSCSPNGEPTINFERNEHPIYGNFFYFSNVPNKKKSNGYVVSVSNSYLSIPFEENGIKIWCIKTYSQIYKKFQ